MERLSNITNCLFKAVGFVAGVITIYEFAVNYIFV